VGGQIGRQDAVAGAKPHRRQPVWGRALVAIVAALMLPIVVPVVVPGSTPAASAQAPPWLQGELDKQAKLDKEDVPPKPQVVRARTGYVEVSPGRARSGQKVTATFTNTAAVGWSLSVEKDVNSRCNAHSLPTKNPHIPPGTLEGGPTTCTWTAVAPPGDKTGWVGVNAGITGPCADWQAYLAHKYEFATCAGAHSADYYLVFGSKEHWLYGQVKGEKGDPVGDVVLEITGDGRTVFVHTGTDGYYAKKLKEGAYRIRATVFDNPQFGYLRPDDFSPANTTVAVHGATEQNFTVKGFKLSGKVRNDKGDGLADMTVVVSNKRSSRKTVTKYDGSYEMTVPRDTYAVEVESSPPPEPGREAINWGKPFVCKMRGETDAKENRVCKLDVNTADASGVDFKADLSLATGIFIARAPDAQGRLNVIVSVIDPQGEPVGNQQVVFRPQTNIEPRVLLCATDGLRRWPVKAPDPTATVLDDKEFTLTTDDQGQINLLLWPGIQAGKWTLEVEPKGSTRSSEKATAEIDIQRVNNPLPSKEDLIARIALALRAKTPAPNEDALIQDTTPYAADDPALVLDQALRALVSKPEYLKASVSPIHTVDGHAAGLLFLEESPSQSALAQVAASFASGGTGAMPPHYVLDVNELASLAKNTRKWSDLKVKLGTLTEFAQRYAAAQAPVAAGRRDANADEQRLTYFGWPYPAIPGGRVDRCNGAEPTGQQVDVHSPVRLTFTSPDGKVVAAPEKNGGEPVLDAPGSWIDFNDKGEAVRYLLPTATWKVDVQATGNGPATLGFIGGIYNDIGRTYRLDVKQGDKGTIDAFDDQGTMTPDAFRFGSNTVKVGQGYGLKVVGLPKTVPAGALQRATVTVTDEFGKPVAGASVSSTYGDVNYKGSSTTDPSGHAKVVLFGPTNQNPLVVKTTMYRYTPVETKITGGPPVPFAVPKDVQAAVGPRPRVDPRFLRELAWIPVLIGGIVLVVMLRRRRARARFEEKVLAA
jgi:hypothetical protein